MKKILGILKSGILYDVFFALFVAVFIGILLWSPKLAPTDDFVFLKTLQSGKFLLYYSSAFPYYDSIELGRFTPLAAMEYNIFGLFSNSPDPFWYFLYHALQATIFALIFVWLLRKFTKNYWLIYGTTALIMLAPGFVITMLRLQLNERNLLFFMTLFVLLYLSYLKKQKTSLAVWLLLVANVIIYYKETAFLAIGAFAFTRLLLFWKTSDAPSQILLDKTWEGKKTGILDSLLFLSSLAYLVIYFFFVYLHSDLLYLGTAPIGLLAYFKRLINYAFFTDSFIYLVLIPIFAIRLYQVFVKKYAPRPLMDPLIVGAVVYTIVYLAIGYGPYYLLPAYAFAIPATFMYFSAKGGSASGGQNQKAVGRWWKLNFAVVATLIVVNVIPSGIHYITYQKYLMWNFNKTLDFLVIDIDKKQEGERADIFLYGTGREGGRGVYEILGDFLKFRGLETNQFDLKSDVEAPAGPLWVGKKMPPFSVFESARAYNIDRGDYLIVPPQSKKLITEEVLGRLSKNYNLVFNTKSNFFFPNINAKSAIKYLLVRRGVSDETLIENENSFATPNYYVFVKKY